MILLNNIVAKHHHRFLRNRLKDVTAQLLRDSQAGARPDQSTDFVTHTTLTYLHDLERRGNTEVMLFLDLKDAFSEAMKQGDSLLSKVGGFFRDLGRKVSADASDLPPPPTLSKRASSALAGAASAAGAPVADSGRRIEKSCVVCVGVATADSEKE